MSPHFGPHEAHKGTHEVTTFSIGGNIRGELPKVFVAFFAFILFMLVFQAVLAEEVEDEASIYLERTKLFQGDNQTLQISGIVPEKMVIIWVRHDETGLLKFSDERNSTTRNITVVFEIGRTWGIGFYTVMVFQEGIRVVETDMEVLINPNAALEQLRLDNVELRGLIQTLMWVIIGISIGWPASIGIIALVTYFRTKYPSWEFRIWKEAGKKPKTRLMKVSPDKWFVANLRDIANLENSILKARRYFATLEDRRTKSDGLLHRLRPKLKEVRDERQFLKAEMTKATKFIKDGEQEILRRYEEELPGDVSPDIVLPAPELPSFSEPPLVAKDVEEDGTALADLAAEFQFDLGGIDLTNVKYRELFAYLQTRAHDLMGHNINHVAGKVWRAVKEWRTNNGPIK